MRKRLDLRNIHDDIPDCKRVLNMDSGCHQALWFLQFCYLVTSNHFGSTIYQFHHSSRKPPSRLENCKFTMNFSCLEILYLKVFSSAWMSIIHFQFFHGKWISCQSKMDKKRQNQCFHLANLCGSDFEIELS